MEKDMEAWELEQENNKNLRGQKLLILKIAEKATKLTIKSDIIPIDENDYKIYYNDYISQLRDGSYNQFLRSWIGYFSQDKNLEAIDILKDIINLNLLKYQNKKIMKFL